MATLTAASNYLENALLNHALRNVTYTPPSACYVALFTAAPTDAGGGTEVAGGSYARQAAAFGAAATRSATTTADIDWTDLPAGTITHLAIFDAATAGNMLLWGELDAPVAITAGDPLSIATGDLTVTFQAGPVTDYLAGELLDHVLRSESYSPAATVELALYTDADVEVAGAGYARQSQGYAAASGGSATSNSAASFTNLPAATIASAGLHEDAAGGGQRLLYGSLGTPRAVSAGATWECPVGASVVTLD